MAGKNYGTMFMGFYYDRSRTSVGYNVYVENDIYFDHVAYHSKGQLISQLIHCGYKKEDIIVERVVNK